METLANVFLVYQKMLFHFYANMQTIAGVLLMLIHPYILTELTR